MTLKEAIEQRIRQSEEERPADSEDWTGGDWWQLLPEEAFIFDIEEERWPRMMCAWFFFEVFNKMADVGEDEAPVALLHEESARRPDIEFCRAGFDLFAVEYAGLTFREAAAAYAKMHFSNVREGLIEYKDEALLGNLAPHYKM